ncbi:MAG: YbhB/YbcL family Raf kinase inhibitor-like protein [Rhizomicrobium sp.]
MWKILAAPAALWTLLSGPAVAMELTSGDIAPGAPIAVAQIYPRCGGQNISPALSWSGAPAATKSFVLTMIDTDVKPAQWSHWIVADLPPGATSLARGVGTLPGAARAVASNFGDRFYDGPCPPTGTGVHHYEITIWAMPAAATSITPNAKAADVSAALARTALDHATLTGWVQR